MSTRAKQKQQTPSPKLVTWSGPDAVPESVKPRLLRETLHVFHDMPFLPWSEMEVTLTVAVDGTWFRADVLVVYAPTKLQLGVAGTFQRKTGELLQSNRGLDGIPDAYGW